MKEGAAGKGCVRESKVKCSWKEIIEGKKSRKRNQTNSDKIIAGMVEIGEKNNKNVKE